MRKEYFIDMRGGKGRGKVIRVKMKKKQLRREEDRRICD